MIHSHDDAASRTIDLRLIAAAAVLVAAFLLGGTSGDIPARAMLIELIAVAALGWGAACWRGPRPTMTVIVVAALIMILPLVQIIPLPPGWWKALPGRAVMVDIAGYIGGSQWRPLSLDPDATLRAWLGLLPPLALFVLGMQLSGAGRRRAIAVLIGLAGISVVLGLLQRITGTGQLFADAVAGLPTGLFGNRNHQASFLVVAAIFTFAMATSARPQQPILRVAYVSLIALFVAGIFATGSRAGIALLAFAAVISPFLLVRQVARWKLALGLAVILGSAALLLLRSEVVLGALDRFDAMGSNGRYRFWPEVVFAIRTYFPFGSGIGTFVQSFQGIEALDGIDTRFINHAHNDYLEILLESGVAGFALLTVALLLVLRKAWQVFFEVDRDRNLLARAAVLALVVLILHSLVDYPLRTFAMQAVCGLLLGIIVAAAARTSSRHRVHDDAASPGNGRIAVVGVVCLGLAILVSLVGASNIALARGRPDLALRLWSSGSAASARAEQLLGEGKPQAALELASQALARAPQNSAALRTAARAAEAVGRADAARTGWILAARLGWRDGFVQRWLLEQATAQHDDVAAAQAADAMMRIDFQRPIAVQGLLDLLQTAGGRAAVADRMAAHASWNGTFFDQFVQQPASGSANAILFIAELQRRAAMPTGADADAVFKRLLADGRGAELLAIWRQLNPGVPGDPLLGVVDGNFTALSQGRTRGPFGWRGGDEASVTLKALPRAELSSEQALNVESFADRRVAALSQLLALKPGNYALRFDAQLVRGAASDFGWEISCDVQRRKLLRAPLTDSGGLWTTQEARFTIPATGCTSQMLRLLTGPTGEEGSVANLGRVSSAAAPAPASRARVRLR